MVLTKVKIATAVLLLGIFCLGTYSSWAISPRGPDDPKRISASSEDSLEETLAPAPEGLESDPLPPGALVRLGTNRLRQLGGNGSVAFSPNGKVLGVVGWDQRCLLEVASGRLLEKRSESELFLRSVAFSPEGKRLATAGDDGTALIWKLTPELIDP